MTFLLKGAVKQLRTAKSLSEDITYTSFIVNQKGERIKNKSYTVSPKNHNVKNTYHHCLKVVNLPLASFDNKPSYSAIKEGVKRQIIPENKIKGKSFYSMWNKLDLEKKIQIHMSDWCETHNALSAKW